MFRCVETPDNLKSQERDSSDGKARLARKRECDLLLDVKSLTSKSFQEEELMHSRHRVDPAICAEENMVIHSDDGHRKHQIAQETADLVRHTHNYHAPERVPSSEPTGQPTNWSCTS